MVLLNKEDTGPVCDSCLDAADEDGMPIEELSYGDLVDLMKTYGDELSDHNCDTMENALWICECGCKRNWKRNNNGTS